MPGERPTPPEARGFESKEPREPELEKIVERERDKLREFFGEPIEPGPLPKEITTERVREWREKGFELHWIPDEKYDQKDAAPGWKVPPPRNVSKETRGDSYRKGEPYVFYPWKNVRDFQGLKFNELPGEWQLWDEHRPPSWGKKEDDGLRKENRYENDEAIEKILGHGRLGGELFDQVHDKVVLSRIAEYLGVSGEKVRFPRFIEYSYVGNAYHPEWGEAWGATFLEDIYGKPQLTEYAEEVISEEIATRKEYGGLTPTQAAVKKWGAYVPNDNESKWRADSLVWDISRLWVPSWHPGNPRFGQPPTSALAGFSVIPERHGMPIDMGVRFVVSFGAREPHEKKAEAQARRKTTSTSKEVKKEEENVDTFKAEIARLFAEVSRLPAGFHKRNPEDFDSDLAVSPDGYVVGVPKSDSPRRAWKNK